PGPRVEPPGARGPGRCAPARHRPLDRGQMEISARWSGENDTESTLGSDPGSDPNCMVRVRLDQLMLDRQLAPSRERARALVIAGQVTVDGKTVTKAGTAVDDTAEIALAAPDHPYVCRGGAKLAPALDTFQIPVAGREGP